ncbi:hypothetical protein OOK29_25885 [Streptomyces phaeochromogenes]|uniref:hypothetical protein n=1 Tax=Streptomyces phaeochromogenes TaxID=1923 RepID=UPI00225B4D25|nr:hypothetical protein [Streptomyces phaeochromogenes]MCX5601585.1 hypothetical protein [Streptomyces phaeochromogenes]
MSRPSPKPDDRVRTHIKALTEEMKHQASDTDTPLHVQGFLSGMLSGLTASVEILDGGTAEGSMEKMNQRLAAAIGQAYLDGKLPAQPPAPAAEAEQEEASSPNTLRAELEQAQAAIKRVRALLPDDPADDLRAPSIVPGGLRAVLDDALAPAEAMRAAGSPVTTDPFTGLVSWKAADHVGHGSPCEENADGSCAGPSALREQVIAAILRTVDDGLGATSAEAQLAGDLADSVLAVILPGIRRADAVLDRVTDLCEQWVKAGPPKLGTSLSRWWDARLIELREAILGRDPKDPS